MSKNGESRKATASCTLCQADFEVTEGLTLSLQGLLENGQKYEAVYWVCWFCSLDPEAPLPVSACQVPHNSTRNKSNLILTASRTGLLRQ